MNKFKAIAALHPLAYAIRENDGVYTAETEDGTSIELDMAAVDTKETELIAEANAEAAAKLAAKAAGNQKLLDLGLTQEEATALTGYAPPSE